MVYLILAILSSTLVSLTMRLSEERVQNTMAMFAANYAACAAVAAIYTGFAVPAETGFGFAAGLGVVGGAAFLLSFLLLRLNIRRNGVVLSAIFMKLGVLVPIAIAMVFFAEVPTLAQWAGFCLAVAAILVINLEPGSRFGGRLSGLLLILLLLAGGLTDSFIKIYDELGSAEWKDHFLLCIFASACLICVLIAAVQRRRIGAKDLIFGMTIGIPNYFSSRFLLLSLGSVSAIVAYPVYNAATIVLITLAGVAFFREKLNRRKCIGIGLILAALILLNI